MNQNDQLMNVDVSLVEPECNDRNVFDENDLETLADSIRLNGLAQPITVRPKPSGAGYWIVAGERRWRAHVMLGEPQIQAFVRRLDDAEASNIMLVENLARKDLNPLEEGQAYRKRLDAGMAIEDLAQVAGVTVERITWRVGLLSLCPYISQLVASSVLGPGYASCMIGLDEQRQMLALAALNEKNLTLQDLEMLCAGLLSDQNQGCMFDTDSFMQIDEIVADVSRRNWKLSSMQLTRLVARVLEAIDFDETSLSADQSADLTQLRSVIEHRLPAKKSKSRKQSKKPS